MKWLFSILLIANLGMFIWLYPQQDGAAAIMAHPADVGQLRLVGEPVIETTPSASQPPLESPANATRVEIESPVEPEAAEPERLSTTEPPVEPPLVETEQPNETAASAPAEEPVCASIGGFDKRSQAELLSVRLLAQGVKTEITSETSNEQAGFWVLIPPQVDRSAAIDIAKELERAGVSDLWRFTSGQLAHAISLGLFRDEERARARRDKIAEMGFAPEVRPRYRELTKYWLNFRFTGETPLSEDRWLELRQQNPELERNQAPCP